MSRFRTSALAAGFLCALVQPLAARAQDQAAPPSLTDPKGFYAFIQKQMAADAKGTRESLKASTFAPPAASSPKNHAQLDAMLAKKEWEPLLTTLQNANTAEAVEADLDWERLKIYEGAGIIVSIAYMRDLWRVGEATPGQGGDNVKQSAVAIGLYLDAVMTVDGARCADAAAPGFRRNQLFSQQPYVWSYAKGLPKDMRNTITSVALLYEAVTAPVRQNDDVLCQGPTTGSMVEILEGMVAMAKAGQQPKEVKRPDMIGKSYEIPRAPPHFVDEAQWRPRADAARAGLADQLMQAAAKGATP